MIVRNGWTMLVIPAVATEDVTYQIGPGEHDVHHRREGDLLLPDRLPQQELDAMRREMGSVNFSAQYQQAPVPPGGAIIKRDWLRYFTKEPHRFDRKIVSWDTASTTGPRSDYSVGTVWGLKGLDHYLLDIVRGRFEGPELRRRIVDLHHAERANATLIENTELGRLMAQDLRHAKVMSVLLPVPRRDKEARLNAQAAKFEAGQVWLPQEAPWLAMYLRELLGFPNVTYKDQVDSTTQALKHLTRHQRRPTTDRTGQYGPTGRRTRASLTRPTIEPRLPSLDELYEEELVAPDGLVVRSVPADWEPHQDRPRRRRG